MLIETYSLFEKFNFEKVLHLAFYVSRSAFCVLNSAIRVICLGSCFLALVSSYLLRTRNSELPTPDYVPMSFFLPLTSYFCYQGIFRNKVLRNKISEIKKRNASKLNRKNCSFFLLNSRTLIFVFSNLSIS